MKKLYETEVDNPLTPARRKKIDKFIASNAHLAPANVSVSHEWVDEPVSALHVSTPPVKWEVTFDGGHVEIHADAPFWARLLFTKEKQNEFKEQVEKLLHKTGFYGKDEEKAPSRKKPAGKAAKKPTKHVA